MSEHTGCWLVAGYPFYGTNPNPVSGVFGDIFDHIIFYSTGSVLVIIKCFEGRSIETIQSIPGSYPEDLIITLENGIDRTIGKTVAAV
jgi:hypothetical protein